MYYCGRKICHVELLLDGDYKCSLDVLLIYKQIGTINLIFYTFLLTFYFTQIIKNFKYLVIRFTGKK